MKPKPTFKASHIEYIRENGYKMTYFDICLELDISLDHVKAIAKFLGIVKSRPWTAEEDKIVRNNDYHTACKLLDYRAKSSVANRRNTLGISSKNMKQNY